MSTIFQVDLRAASAARHDVPSNQLTIPVTLRCISTTARSSPRGIAWRDVPEVFAPGRRSGPGTGG